MASVCWTPFEANRSFTPGDGAHNIIFMYLESAAGEPLTGVVEADIAALKVAVFAQQSYTGEIDILADDAVFPTTWSPFPPAGSTDAFPGMYAFRVDADAIANLGAGPDGAHPHTQVVFSLTLSADTSRKFLANVNVTSEESGGSEGGGGGIDLSNEEDIMLFFGMLGYNTTYRYTSFDSGGRPLVGTMTIYRTFAAAEAEDSDEILATVDLTYEYENGRLKCVRKLIDPSSFMGGEEG